MSKNQTINTMLRNRHSRHNPHYHINSQFVIALFILFLLTLSPLILNQLISTPLPSTELRIQELFAMHLLKALNKGLEVV
jgi:hypothetical protein